MPSPKEQHRWPVCPPLSTLPHPTPPNPTLMGKFYSLSYFMGEDRGLFPPQKDSLGEHLFLQSPSTNLPPFWPPHPPEPATANEAHWAVDWIPVFILSMIETGSWRTFQGISSDTLCWRSDVTLRGSGASSQPRSNLNLGENMVAAASIWRNSWASKYDVRPSG